MEKAQQEKPKSLVWDCGSSLYDSFEFKSLEHQLNSAISSSRTLSMPHLPDRRAHPPPPPRKPLPTKHLAKRPSKISMSFQKLVRSIFGPKQSNNISLFKKKDGAKDGFGNHFFYAPGSLYTIPEVAESGRDLHGDSPDDFNSSLVGRSVSDRFTSTASISVSCA